MLPTRLLNPWFQFARPNPQARLRLFCFSYAGGSASLFRQWHDQLPASIELYPVQLPGRENRMKEPPFTRLSPLVQALVQAIQPHLEKPFAFFGHSMGALVSFELARELRRRRLAAPISLMVSARRAPQLPNPDPPIHDLPTEEFIEEIRDLKGTPEEILRNDDLMQMVLPILRADFAVCETYSYRYEAPLACPITAFGGWHDEISEDEVAAWKEQTRGPFSLCMFESGHFFLHSERGQLVQSITQSLLPLLNHDLSRRAPF